MTIETLAEPGEVERRLAEALRMRSVENIQQRHDSASVAAALGISEIGVRALMWQLEWPVDQAVRVAAALGLINERFVDQLLRHTA